jgi:hypothetical protein
VDKVLLLVIFLFYHYYTHGTAEHTTHLPVVNPNATTEQMVQLCKEGAVFEKACQNLTSKTLG